MKRVWLKPNRRILGLAIAPVLGIGLTGVVLVMRETPIPLWWVGIALVGLTVLLSLALFQQWMRPRIGYGDGRVLFYMTAGQPIPVPIDVVEAFFLGRGPADLPEIDAVETESLNLVARLSRKHPEWAQKEVKKTLGSWCDGYVTIRGTWCETLDESLIRELNRNLTLASRERTQTADESAS